MSATLWIIGTLIAWLAACWLVSRFLAINGKDMDDDTQIDSIRAQLDLSDREVKERPRVRAGK